MRIPTLIAAAILGTAALPSSARAADPVGCKLDFSLAGWSIFYKTAAGDGVVSCDNGQRLPVHVKSTGGGITFGKSHIDNAKGTFTGVHDIKDVVGGYATAEAHAGAGKSTKAQVLTKGDISLSLTGKGTGIDLGVAVGKFEIKERK